MPKLLPVAVLFASVLPIMTSLAKPPPAGPPAPPPSAPSLASSAQAPAQAPPSAQPSPPVQPSPSPDAAVTTVENAPVGTPTPIPVPPPVPASTPKPGGPLATPAVTVARPDKVLIETIALAGHRLVAGGLDGLLILSDDNGVTWRQAPFPVQATLTAIRFIDDRVGWAVGHYGVVLRTDDGGEHWTLVEDGRRAAEATLDAARAGNEADSVRARRIQAAQALVRDDPARPFLLIQCSGSDTVRLIGAGLLSAETNDGGRHWRPWSAGVGNPDGVRLDGLAARNGLLLAAGAHGTLLAGQPEDGLHKMPSPYDGTFFGVLDAGAFGFLLFGQQGHAYAGIPAADWGPAKPLTWHPIADPSQATLTAGLVRQDGSVLLADATGAIWKLAGKPDTPRLEATSAQAPFPILAIAEAADRSLILAGSGGIVRLPPPP